MFVQSVLVLHERGGFSNEPALLAQKPQKMFVCVGELSVAVSD